MAIFKRNAFILALLIFTAALIYAGFIKRNEKKIFLNSVNSTNIDEGVKNNMIRLSSEVFENNGTIPRKYTCDGDNINPPLNIENVPENADSLAIIVDDPDAPSGDFVHWLIWNIDPKTTNINEGQVPSDSVQGLNDAGKEGFTGPCPPSGTHRYQFKLYALDTKLNLDTNTNKAGLVAAMEGHVLDSTLLTGLYARE